MFVNIFCVVLIANSALSRNVPNFEDLDEEDQMLFRAAYDTQSDQEIPSYKPPQTYAPSYNHETPSYKPPSYNLDDYHTNEIPISKLDLLKDGMWALKAKMKELKAFNKALAANLLLTKLKVKDLMEHIKPLKKHQHLDVDKKPVYNYQPSPPPQSYPQYEKPYPQYTEPASSSQYPAQHYSTSQHEYDPYYGH